jgi:hypothetical protein
MVKLVPKASYGHFVGGMFFANKVDNSSKDYI